MEPADILSNTAEFNSLLRFLKTKPLIPSFALALIQKQVSERLYPNQLLLISELVRTKQFLLEALQFLSKPCGLQQDRLVLVERVLNEIHLVNFCLPSAPSSSATDIEFEAMISKDSLRMLLVMAELVSELLCLDEVFDVKLLKLKIILQIVSESDPTLLVQFLPGIMGSMAKNIWRNGLENHQVVVLSIQTAGILVSKTLNDEYFSQLAGDSGVNGPQSSKLVFRNREWLESTKANIGKVLALLQTFKTSHPRIRLQYVTEVFRLLESSPVSLGTQNVAELVDIFAHFYSDENEEIRCFMKSKIPLLKSLPEFYNIKYHLEMTLRTDLKILNTKMDVNIIPKLVGIIGILSDKSSNLIETYGHEIVEILIQLYAPSLTDASILDTTGASQHLTSIEQQKIKLIAGGFPSNKWINDIRVADQFLDVAAVQREDIIVPYLMDRLNSNAFEVVSIFNRLLAKDKECNSCDWIEPLLQEYLNLSALKAPVTFKENNLLLIHEAKKVELPLFKPHLNVLTTSAILEGISLMAPRLSPNQFAYLMMDGLYLILEKLGSDNFIINSSAIATLESLSDAQYLSQNNLMLSSPLALESDNDLIQGKISKLVTSNIDYILDTLSQKLRFCTRNPMAPKVLTAAVKVAQKRIIPAIMVDVMDQVLDILDEIGTGSQLQLESDHLDCEIIVEELLHTLKAIVDAAQLDTVTSPFTKKILGNEVSAYEEESNASPDMRQFLLNYEKRKQILLETKADSAKDFFAASKSDIDSKENKITTGDIMSQNNEDEDEDLLINQNQAIIISVLKRIMPFLSSDSPKTRLIVLDIYTAGLPSLRNLPKELNPIIALLWSRVLIRTKDSIFYCAIAATNLLGCMICLSPEFCRKRIEDDVMKTILQILQRIHQTTMETFNKNSKQLSHNQLVKGSFLSSSDSSIYQSALKILGYILDGNVTLKLEEECKLVVVLIGFLNTRLYTSTVIAATNSLLSNLYYRCSDWVWCILWANLGGDRLLNGDGSVTVLSGSEKENLITPGDVDDFNFEILLSLTKSDPRSHDLLLELLH